ncbi:MAG: GspMb/PilO family protein [Planctomycetota bacterium]
MKQRPWWLYVAGGGLLAALGIGTLIYFQYGKIEQSRAEVANLRTGIDAARKEIEGTAAQEREVIVLRELSEVMKQILPDTDDVNNLVRTLQAFSEESKVRISGLKRKMSTSKDKSGFDKVAYTLSFEADAFQLLEFLDMIEGHSRFMRVPSLRLNGAQRQQIEQNGVPAHKVQMDIETYVYEPRNDAKQVKIDSFDRKRDLLMGEINRRRQSLAVSTYNYRGARGRRDPWIDPRVPVMGDGESALTVPEQMEIVQGLYDRVQEVLAKWKQVQDPKVNVIQAMLIRSELEGMLGELEEDVRRIESERAVRYVPSERRLQSEVVEVLAKLREDLLAFESGSGPSNDTLREIEETMVRHQDAGEYKLMLEAYSVIEDRLALIENDPLRKPLVDRLRELANESRAILDFEKIDMKITGIAIMQDAQPVAVINGKSVGVGDMLNYEIMVHAIRTDEIEFVFRGVVFARRF